MTRQKKKKNLVSEGNERKLRAKISKEREQKQLKELHTGNIPLFYHYSGIGEKKIRSKDKRQFSVRRENAYRACLLFSVL